MKVIVKRACGHTTAEALYGSAAERERKTRWLDRSVCTACYRAAELTQAQCQTSTLPTLTGSQAQIDWATTIRAGALIQVDAVGDHCTTPADQVLFAELHDRLTNITAAAWWISQRGASAHVLLNAVRTSSPT